MTTYRAGQRVKVEVEGAIAAVYEGRELARVDSADDPQVITVQVPGHGHMEFSPSCSRVTVLSEPRPDEPQGLGAVVEASWSHQGGVSPQSAEKWVRLPAPDGGRWWHDGRYVAHWENLIDPVVLSEGWQP